MKTVAVSLGLLGTLFATSTLAADLQVGMPTPASPAVLVPAFSWTGLYVGGEFGGGWGHSQSTAVTGNRVFPPRI
jgi:outer membrane immunogenic protein